MQFALAGPGLANELQGDEVRLEFIPQQFLGDVDHIAGVVGLQQAQGQVVQACRELLVLAGDLHQLHQLALELTVTVA
ncbi:MAG: hypothetical protein D6717_02905 [Gammaproteobacteria bacterium]|nr:MAG: hypothetical protein D6717_02905 [Gammaproteobacteria bacterium]